MLRQGITLSSTLKRGSNGVEVRAVQEMLNLAQSRPRLTADGDFGSLTEQSVRSFQSSHGLGVDGKIGPQTARALQDAAHVEQTYRARPVVNAPAGPVTNPQPAHPTTTTPASPTTPAHPTTPAITAPTNPIVTPTTGGSGYSFPFSHAPDISWKTGARFFGAPRAKGRLHAGCDLIAPAGTQIYAIADGVLKRAPYYFYTGTWAVEIIHGDFIIRYGEIAPNSYTGGQRVTKGQPIAKVGRLDSGSHMLHFEMYTNVHDSGPLTTSRGPYKRREDVINASSHLDEWIHYFPGGR